MCGAGSIVLDNVVKKISIEPINGESHLNFYRNTDKSSLKILNYKKSFFHLTH